MNARRAAVLAILAVVRDGVSLAAALPSLLEQSDDARERAFAQELSYGVLRWHPRLLAILNQLLNKPLKTRDLDIQCLLLVGLYQLLELRVAPHAAVAATVEVARELDKPWATGLINGVLRNCQRSPDVVARAIAESPEAQFAHPQWLLERLRADWPEHWQAIAQANNGRPPMALRVNTSKSERDRYLEMLAAADIAAHAGPHAPAAVILEQPLDVARLPGFRDGLVSVQDTAAQLAAPLLRLHAGQRVLDACAAPGGKTAHILEREPRLREVVALDLDAQRLERVRENLTRLDLRARLVCGDACEPAQWWDGEPFDRILLDAPCSATGVIRRHPDIKMLRKPGDIATLAATQERMLEALWPLLARGGMLLYATCSVLAAENEERIDAFLQVQDDAEDCMPEVGWGHARSRGRQILPGQEGMDGFYFACLSKR